MSEYVRFIQRIGLVGLTNILISLSSLIFIPIITKSFTTAEYGMWAQVNTTIALVPNIANLGLPYTMVRFLSAEKDKEKNSAANQELKNKLSGLEMLYKSRKNGFEQAKAEFEKALYELKDRQQRRKILTDLENNMEGFAGSVKLVLKAGKQGRISGVLGTVKRVCG